MKANDSKSPFSDYKSAALPTELCRHLRRKTPLFQSAFKGHCIRHLYTVTPNSPDLVRNSDSVSSGATLRVFIQSTSSFADLRFLLTRVVATCSGHRAGQPTVCWKHGNALRHVRHRRTSLGNHNRSELD